MQRAEAGQSGIYLHAYITVNVLNPILVVTVDILYRRCAQEHSATTQKLAFSRLL